MTPDFDEKQPVISEGSLDELDDAPEINSPLPGKDLPDDDAPGTDEEPAGDVEDGDAGAEGGEGADAADPDADTGDEPVPDAKAEDVDADVVDDETDPDEEPDAEEAEGDGLNPELLSEEQPETAGDYLLHEHPALPADSPLIQEFKEVAHRHGLSQLALTEALSLLTKQHDALAAADANHVEAVTPALRKAWGNTFDADVAGIKQLLADPKAFPPGVAELIRTGRSADGRRLSNDVGVLNWLRESAKGRDPKTQRGSRIAELEKIQKTDADRYAREFSDEHLDLMTAESAGLPAEPIAADEARLSVIEGIMRSDSDRYWRDGLDTEHLELITRGVGQQQQRSRRRA